MRLFENKEIFGREACGNGRQGMHHMKQMKVLLTTCFLFLCSVMLTNFAWADEASGKGSITVETKINDKAIQGMEVRLYQIGTRQDGEFVLDEAYKTEDTKNFDTELNEDLSKDFVLTADSLKDYAEAFVKLSDGKTPTVSGTTAADGKVTLEAPIGLYLLTYVPHDGVTASPGIL